MAFRNIKSFLFNFFHFNKQERNGVFVLSIIITFLIIIRLAVPVITQHENQIILYEKPFTNIKDTLTMNNYEPLNNKVTERSGNTIINHKLFVFNPNTISQLDAERLGFSKKLSATLINFRNKGGKFYKPQDLKKLYGMSSILFHHLEPYILISNLTQAYKKDTIHSVFQKKVEKNKILKESIEINSADSLSIVYLKGIGPSFTKRIIKYRTVLGGFHSINQLKEIYGMTDSLFDNLVSQIKIDPNLITKIQINSIDFNTLRKHPYFNFQSAQAVVNYRLKHGRLTQKEFEKIGIFSEEKMQLILPYLMYN